MTTWPWWCARGDLMTSKECVRSTPSKRSFFDIRKESVMLHEERLEISCGA
jgi:hypothetical protein